MDVDVFDDDGQPIREGIGHLVLKQPAPSLTKSFLGDDARYLATYFERFGARSGTTATGRTSTRTASGSCTAAATTR